MYEPAAPSIKGWSHSSICTSVDLYLSVQEFACGIPGQIMAGALYGS